MKEAGVFRRHPVSMIETLHVLLEGGILSLGAVTEAMMKDS